VVLPVAAPETRISEAVAGVRVKPGVTTLAVTVVEAVAAIDELAVVPVPVTAAVRTPLVPAVVTMVRVLVPVPPDVTVTELGETEQLPAAVPVPLRLAALQVRAIVPAKPLVEAAVMVLVTVLPEKRLPDVGRDAGDAIRVKADAVRLTVITADVTLVDPLVPLTAKVRTPDVPVVVVMVSVLVAKPPAASVTALGVKLQPPAAVPLEETRAQLSCSVAAKLLTEATVMRSVLPVAAPEIRLYVVLAGVIVKVAALMTREIVGEVDVAKLVSPV